jgi:hypothetical protein
MVTMSKRKTLVCLKEIKELIKMETFAVATWMLEAIHEAVR